MYFYQVWYSQVRMVNAEIIVLFVRSYVKVILEP